MFHYKFDPDIHCRRSIRLKDFDYSQDGRYFITICVQDREYLFGKIEDGKMILSDSGKMIDRWWNALESRFQITVDSYVIMPNHFHGIIGIKKMPVGATQCGRPNDSRGRPNDSRGRPNDSRGRPDPENQCDHPNEYQSNSEVWDIIGWFKTMTTNEYIRNTKSGNWPPFNKHLWQRNYYEHVIQAEQEYIKILEYILNNPKNWIMDELFLKK